MARDSRCFGYTADRHSYLSTAVVLISMVLVEGGIVGGLGFWLANSPVFKWGIVGLMVTLLLVAVVRLLGPLVTCHRVEDGVLKLRYGLSLRANIPLNRIQSARPVHRKADKLQTRARYDARNRQVTACFSEQNQLEVQLLEPISAGYGFFGRVTAASFVFNADRRDKLLAVLGAAGDTGQLFPGRLQEPHPPAPEALPPLLLFSRPPEESQGQPGIRTAGLSRRYGDRLVVNQLNLSIHPGEIYGFLGANGAGKTTTIKMLVGLLQPSAGRVWIGGHDLWAEPVAAKSRLGVVLDRTPLYGRLSGREYLEFLGQMRGLPAAETRERLERLLSVLGLMDQADESTGTYSFGMKRKLGLAAAMLHNPSVLILDEPFTGLDPISARRLKAILREVSGEGTAIFLSIHDLATAEAVCHRVGILHRGQFVAEGESEELRKVVNAPNLEEAFLALTETPAGEVIE